MAKIDWTENFSHLLDYYIGNAIVEYGNSTAMRWVKEIKAIEKRLKMYPTSFTPESLLKTKKELYRGCHVMHRRFKIIYYYDEAEDTVRLVDIWDTRMNPKTLTKKIR